MSCAGCDDCDPTKWHLHVTVKKQSWSNEWMPWFSSDCQRIGVKPVRVWNLFHDDRKSIMDKTHVSRSYEEFIPTLAFSGTEAEATAALFSIGNSLIGLGYHVERLKMEANPNVASERRMLYAESHVKVKNITGHRASADLLKVPVSVVNASDDYFIITGRYNSIAECHAFIDNMQKEFNSGIVELPRVELCTLDTNPGKDKAWLAQ